MTTDSEVAAHTVAGTPAYIAPELLRGAPANAQSDVYAAGIVLYETATGQTPFPGLPTGPLLEAILHVAPPAPRTRNPAISPAFESVILKCVEKQPERRYGSARELGDDLKRLGTGAKSPHRPRSRTRRMTSVALLAVALAVTAGIFLWNRLQPSPASELRSLAVLPLGNLSRDPEQEYFADGMTDELIAELSAA